ncbi:MULTISPECIES: hypothetical protein [unclassified Campylobacter]|uniref:hypothetical protein n=1 Tax=unclassified Campylobacter TaxID=2593542 RepID=UPI0022E9D4DF|nr:MULTISPECIES: hypothetical protein [unclassified Campylobacter]MDA3042485.1 glycosyltransferase family 39 protein [Campylobacter sp. JMF_09 ED2]MDA3044701.1 glycosyltransferase family 39 protein [Campylobacter sp. JMF_07 ED4]MDA3063177.1 glycosyltransferase family 39 protein [Campylobacter sp. JMF_11 EL3]MDA3071678.1 glycosyltransferase family 39 protein [Campylobacter sp. VBCF_03 NA9]MDA3074258.1 glycosyltransferase family 39 protein [Campylobacter sp. JMF_05 ED3]
MSLEKFIKNEILILAILFCADALFLIYAISNLSISYYEAEIFYNQNSLTSLIANVSCKIFSQNDYALRAPFLILHFINCALIYKNSKFTLKRRFDRLVATALFMGLPASMSSAILLNPAGIIIFATLLAYYFAKIKNWGALIAVLVLSAFIDRAFFMLYIGFGIWALRSGKREIFVLNLALFVFSIIFYDIGTQGKPRGYFLDALGVFAGAFSPFVFLFFVYAIYRIWIKENKDLLWYIATSAFCLALIFSLRQRVAMEMMLPYCVIATPLIVRVVFNSYRVRLPRFRSFHKFALGVSLFSLVFSYFSVIFSDAMYVVFFQNRPSKHFIYKFDVAKNLANELKKRGVASVLCDDEQMQLRLKFYGINKGFDAIIEEKNERNFDQSIDIYKLGVQIAKFYVKI